MTVSGGQHPGLTSAQPSGFVQFMTGPVTAGGMVALTLAVTLVSVVVSVRFEEARLVVACVGVVAAAMSAAAKLGNDIAPPAVNSVAQDKLKLVEASAGVCGVAAVAAVALCELI